MFFVARFLPGLRAAIFCTAGAMRVRYLHFLFFDGVAARVRNESPHKERCPLDTFSTFASPEFASDPWCDQVALFTFDRELTPWMTFEQWNATPVGERGAVARNRLAAVSPGWAGTRLDQALIRAADVLAHAALPAGTELLALAPMEVKRVEE